MKLKRIILFVLVMILLSAALMVPVFASGDTKEVCVTQYGGATDCHTETINEEVTHGTVNAGLGDNLVLIAGLMAGGSGLLFLLSKVTKRAYWLD
jgi:hypothetical protein